MPLYIRIFKAAKSFNPSADPSVSLIPRGKLAEGFGFQTLQPIHPTLQPDFSYSAKPSAYSAKPFSLFSQPFSLAGTLQLGRKPLASTQFPDPPDSCATSPGFGATIRRVVTLSPASVLLPRPYRSWPCRSRDSGFLRITSWAYTNALYR